MIPAAGLFAIAAGVGLLLASRGTTGSPAPGSVTSALPSPRWRLPASGEPYADEIARASEAHGVPADLLGRVLWQESRFRPDIIDGTVRSSAGAVGIAQFMPATADDLGIDPLDPSQAIDGAARYLAQLHRMFGNWREALAAYNWGMGNVSRRGLEKAPAETREYVSSVMGDVFGSENV